MFLVCHIPIPYFLLHSRLLPRTSSWDFGSAILSHQHFFAVFWSSWHTRVVISHLESLTLDMMQRQRPRQYDTMARAQGSVVRIRMRDDTERSGDKKGVCESESG